MEQLIRSFVLFVLLSGINTVLAQRKIESPKVIVIEQEGDSIFCMERELLFEVLDFEFDSCHLSNNKFALTFKLINKTKQVLFVDPCYVSWYDTNYLRAKGSDLKAVKPEESILITLESIPYGKRRMNSPGKLLILHEKKELYIPMRLKQESSKIKCSE